MCAWRMRIARNDVLRQNIEQREFVHAEVKRLIGRRRAELQREREGGGRQESSAHRGGRNRNSLDFSFLQLVGQMVA